MTVLMGLGLRLRMAKLQVITDARASLKELREFAKATFAGGADLLQVRDANLSTAELAKALEVVRKEAVFSQALVVSDDIAAASAIDGDIVHLPSSITDVAEARGKLHQWALIGRSAHSVDALRRLASDQQVDYLLVGPVRFAASGPDPVGHAVNELAPFAMPKRSKPWFAVGGITADNIDRVIDIGARRVCVSRAVTLADDPEVAARKLKDRLVQGWADDPDAERYVLGAFHDEPSQPATRASFRP